MTKDTKEMTVIFPGEPEKSLSGPEDWVKKQLRKEFGYHWPAMVRVIEERPTDA